MNVDCSHGNNCCLYFIPVKSIVTTVVEMIEDYTFHSWINGDHSGLNDSA